ncbi:MAG: hypothetical protein NTW18_03660 [Candidatus Omnitrophica bacterium]|nr:hypothetical protein [Candidatus Omnitrophota bacterium]
MSGIRGLATGVGSLPHLDADKALDLIFKFVPNIPFWPQFPKRDFREGMLAQFSENIPCLEIKGNGLVFNPENKEKKLEVFYEKIINDDLDYFKLSASFALGLHKFYERLSNVDLGRIDFIKIQVTGPFTFLAGINDEKGVMLLHDPVFKQAIFKALSMKLRWQIDLFKKFARPIIAFIDEPYLGTFGSAYTSLNREDVVQGLAEFSESVKSKDLFLGLHCCGNTDWSLFTDIPAIDIINFDAYNFQERFVLYAQNLKGFLKRGGIICWGIVPTQSGRIEDSPVSLVNKIKSCIEALVNKGLEGSLLRSQMFISPSCGLGTLKISESEEIYHLLRATSLYIKDNF